MHGDESKSPKRQEFNHLDLQPSSFEGEALLPCEQLSLAEVEVLPLDQMVRHFMKMHQECLAAQPLALRETWTNLAAEEGHQNADLNWIRDLLEELSYEMDLHFQQEEMILFPKALRIARNEKSVDSRDSEFLKLISEKFGGEHRDLAELTSKSKEIIARLVTKPAASPRLIEESSKLDAYLSRLEKVIQMEEGILLPAVRRAVDPNFNTLIS